MKREFLKVLGLEHEVMKTIMKENGRDIENAKAQVKKKYEEKLSSYLKGVLTSC